MTDAEKLEILRVALRDITYISGHDANPLDRAREIAYGCPQSRRPNSTAWTFRNTRQGLASLG